MSVVYIDARDRYSPFYRELTTTLGQGGLDITSDPTRADTVFRIDRDETGQRVLSVNARNVPVEYDVLYTISYAVYLNEETETVVLRNSIIHDVTGPDCVAARLSAISFDNATVVSTGDQSCVHSWGLESGWAGGGEAVLRLHPLSAARRW